MPLKWYILFIFMISKQILAYAPSKQKSHPPRLNNEFPLAKAMGYSKQIPGKTLEERRLGQEYIEQYQELIKASRESFENFDDGEERALRKVNGDDQFDVIRKGTRNRRRSSSKLQSVQGERRERSQALRRDKLNSQGLRSHMLHARHEYVDD